jgi:hypothetical protein
MMNHSLLISSNHKLACDLIALEKVYLEQLSSECTASVAARAGLAYIKYMESTWMPEPLWRSWSQAGRIKASLRLNVPVENILTTTNHLESFNGVLKRKFIHHFQKGGRRIRFDLLIFLIVKQILPEIFLKRKLEANYFQWLSARFQEQAGGRSLTRTRQTSSSDINNLQEYKFSWWQMESELDLQDEISYMIQHHRIGPCNWHNIYTLTTTCASSLVDIRKPNHQRYRLYMNCYGWLSCECPRFRLSGIACKHLWAFRQLLPQLQLPYGFIFPTTETAAKQIFDVLFPHIPSTGIDTIKSSASAPNAMSLPPALLTISREKIQ